jgi:hypothetical protein
MGTVNESAIRAEEPLSKKSGGEILQRTGGLKYGFTE